MVRLVRSVGLARDVGLQTETAIARFSIGSSVDGLNIHYDYWH